MRYLMGHLRGAVNVPFKRLQGPDGRLGPPDQLADAFGEAGLGDDVTPILYDQSDGRNAAMAAWVLEYLGRDDVHVMDILYDEWKEQRREVFYRPVEAEARTFTPRVDQTVRALFGDVAAAGNVKVLDSRSAEEFCGEAVMDHRPGHIPGAVHLPHSEVAGRDGRLLVDDALLHERLSAAGIAPGDRAIVYCRSGVRASLTYLAMRRAGYDVRLYDGSYAEWMDSGYAVA